MRRAAIAVCLLLGACATPPPVQPLPPAPPFGEPGDLLGATGGQLRLKFGEPDLVRAENGSEMWRYDGPQCRAFFFLYPNGPLMRVRHVETVPHGPDIAADLNCLSALRRPVS